MGTVFLVPQVPLLGSGHFFQWDYISHNAIAQSILMMFYREEECKVFSGPGKWVGTENISITIQWETAAAFSKCVFSDFSQNFSFSAGWFFTKNWYFPWGEEKKKKKNFFCFTKIVKKATQLATVRLPLKPRTFFPVLPPPA